MLLLAQQTAQEAPDTVMSGIWSRWDAFCHPQDMVAQLSNLTLVWACIFVVAGILCLLQGYKLYKGVVIALALALGGGLGYQLGSHIQAEVIVAACLAVLLATVAWPFMKFAVAIAGGLAGAVIGANAWSAIAGQINAHSDSMTIPPNTAWAGALIGLLFFGMLSFILFQLSVVMFTSFSGAMLLVMGAIALLLHVPAWQDAVGNSLAASPVVVPVLVIVPAIIGLVIQHHFGGLKNSPAK